MATHLEAIEDVIADHVKEVIQDKMFQVQHCLVDMLERLLWSVKLEYEKEHKKSFPMREIIVHLMKSIHKKGPEGETWTEWDNKGMEAQLNEIAVILNKHGITQLSR